MSFQHGPLQRMIKNVWSHHLDRGKVLTKKHQKGGTEYSDVPIRWTYLILEFVQEESVTSILIFRRLRDGILSQETEMNNNHVDLLMTSCF